MSVVAAQIDSTDKKATGLTAKLSRIGGGTLILGGAAFAAVAGSAIQAGSDLNETLSKTRIILGGASEDVIKFAESAATSLGLSKQSALDGASTFAAFGKSAGLAGKPLGDFSVDLTKLASDMASFNNTTPDEAILALGAGLRGESEPLRRFNVLLDDATLRQQAVKQGIIATTKQALTPQQRVLAAYAEIFKQTTDQQGDFARTQGGLANQQRIANAQFANARIELGTRLVPLLLKGEQAALGLAHGFQSLNSVTDGFLGKATALTVALPVGVFLFDKLKVGAAATAAAFGRVASAVGLSTAANAGAVASATELAVAESAAAVAAEEKALAIANLPAVETAAALATDNLIAANLALAAALEGQVTLQFAGVSGTEALTAARLAQVTATAELAAANETLATTQLTAGAGAGVASAGLGLRALASGAGVAAIGLGVAVIALQRASAAADKLAKSGQNLVADLGGGGSAAELAADKLATYGKGVERIVLSYENQILAGKRLTISTSDLASKIADQGNGVKAADAAFGIARALKAQSDASDKAAAKSQVLAQAEQTYREALADAHTSAAVLERDRQAVIAAAAAQAAIENKVTDAVNRGSGALETNATAVGTAAFAYLHLRDNIKTAIDALDAVITRAQKPIRLQIALDTSVSTAQDALQELINPDTGSSGGGGGSTETAAAKALNAAQKNLTLRDSLQDVKDTAREVEEAEKTLAQAYKDQASAAKEVKDANENLRQVLHGVKADSDAARTAIDNLASAQRAQTGAKLDVQDARRALQIAKNNQPLLGLDVQAAQRKFDETRANLADAQQFGDPQEVAELSDQLRRDQIALNNARIDATAGNEEVTRAELAYSEAKADAKTKTKDLNESHRVLNGTLHGFPANSAEAKAATERLKEANVKARTAADNVATSLRGVDTAQRAVATSALALFRSKADVAGKLDAIGGSAQGASGHMKTLKERTNDAKLALLDLALAAVDADRLAGLGFARSIQHQIEILKFFSASTPLLAHAFDVEIERLSGSLRTFLANDTTAEGDKARADLLREARRNGINFAGPSSSEVVSPTQLRNSRAVGGTTNVNLTVQSLDPKTAGPIVIKALQDHTAINGGVSRVRVLG